MQQVDGCMGYAQGGTMSEIEMLLEEDDGIALRTRPHHTLDRLQ
jgi:hypothetical protein